MTVQLLVAYDGAAFRGFALNDPVPTVARRLIDAIEIVVQHPVSLTCAGRTDAGVHAWGQVVTFVADPRRIDPETMRKSLTNLCGPEVVVREVSIAESDFDARSAAEWRSYRYRILNRQSPDPFVHAHTWHVPRPLDLDAMNAAARAVVGLHDFTSFCRKLEVITREGEEVEAPRIRRIISAEWLRELDDIVRFDVKARSFCYQMVRGLVGTMVDIGRGERSVDDMAKVLHAQDRNRAGPIAPPHGLTLWQVGYP